MAKVQRIGDRWFFWCPGCNENHAPSDAWTFNGNLEKPTFQPSILVNGNPALHNPAALRCHSYVTDGQIKFLGDCDHSLAGQTVDLPEYE